MSGTADTTFSHITPHLPQRPCDSDSSAVQAADKKVAPSGVEALLDVAIESASRELAELSLPYSLLESV